MTKRMIFIETADGTCPSSLFTPKGEAAAAVILYMDVFGPRPALDTMAERLAADGYAVLVPDLFYRAGDYGPFDPKVGFSEPDQAQQLRKLLSDTSQAMTVDDTGAFLARLEKEGFDGPVGAVGYCMGGPRALNAAAAYPDRVRAAASFHGGHLATDAQDSPHRRAAEMKGRIYVGAAGVDGSFPPEQAALFVQSLREAEVDFVLENYVGMGHGWAVPDHRVYDEAGAERHWKRLLTFFDESL